MTFYIVSCHLQIVNFIYFILVKLDAIYLFIFYFIFYFIFLWVIAVARTSGTMLNKSGESGYLCLVPDLRGRALSFSPLNTMLTVKSSYRVFIM